MWCIYYRFIQPLQLRVGCKDTLDPSVTLWMPISLHLHLPALREDASLRRYLPTIPPSRDPRGCVSSPRWLLVAIWGHNGANGGGVDYWE